MWTPQLSFESPENWIELQGLDEGDEWPEDLEDASDDENASRQNEWMEHYYEALEELDK